MRYLLIATHDQNSLHEQNLQVVSAIRQITQEYHVLVMGHKAEKVVEKARSLPGCTQVIYWDNPSFVHMLAEVVSPCLATQFAQYDRLVFASNTTTKNILPRLAARCDISPITDICAIVDQFTFKRPIYAGNAITTVRTEQKQDLLSIRTASFRPCEWSPKVAVLEKKSDAITPVLSTRFIKLSAKASDKPDLLSSKIVVSGGRGLGSKQAFAEIEQLADVLGAAVGASRAAVDAGFVPNDYQVGQTGKIIAPNIYIAVGISGAIQHLAGMKDSQIIIAINKDPDAPIFQIADYGIVGDLFEVLPKLKKYLQEKS